MYMQKTTGLIQKDRPDDYRPFLKDDLFEDVIVDLFVTADSNRDGYIDRNEFYSVRNVLAKLPIIKQL